MGKRAETGCAGVYRRRDWRWPIPLVLLIDVLMLHGVMKSEAIDSVFDYLEQRYRDSGLTSSAAMAHYLRQHLSHAQEARCARACASCMTDHRGSA